ncbi:hypothetical protein [Pseudomonas typographi]|uniref:hypothetical protein n=1 Tax=Pseudomonas typographi TaxID=2715964 RepID=UPI0016871DDF|nr:hypothetical protein [Pseudomonas typographi]MBD1554563.1 hypothetical protein [Pseudomonas typographi]
MTVLLAVTAAASAQSGALQRKAHAVADLDAKPLASLLGGLPMDTQLASRYRQAALHAGLPEGSGAMVARWAIRPHIILSADRMHFVLSSQVRLEGIAGGAMYSAQIEVGSPSLRLCGNDCVDSGELAQAQVNAASDACVSETMTPVALDLQGGAKGTEPERTLRYVLNGQRVAERGRVLPAGVGYVRYLAVNGALKAMPVVLEQGVVTATAPVSRYWRGPFGG